MSIGLDDVIAAETVLSDVDGEAGRLIIRGHDLEELAGRMSFEDVAGMLWDGLVPGVPADLRAGFGGARERAFRYLSPLAGSLSGLTPVEGMRLLLSALPDADQEPALLAVGGSAGAAAQATPRA